MAIKISVIIPCYNVEKYIDTCMNSLLNQTIGLENLEIILVDDCSTDNTVEKLKEYEASYPENIMLILCEENGRQGTARNIGLQYTSGDYISYVDSDDWVRRDMYEILTGIIKETNCDVVQFTHNGFTKYEEDKPLGSISYETYDVDSIEKRRKLLLDGHIFNESCWRKIYKKSMLDEAQVKYAEKVSYEEPLFTYPLKFFVNRVCILDSPLYCYRYNEAGTTANYMQNPSKILEHLQVQMDVYNIVRSYDCYKYFKHEIDLYFIHTYFCEQFYFMKYRGFTFPLPLFKYSAKQLEATLPDWRNNPYLKTVGMAEEVTLLNLIDELKDVPDEKAQEIINNTQATLKE